MRLCAKVFLVFASLALAGCVSTPRQSTMSEAVWETPQTVVAPGPMFPVGGPIEGGLDETTKPSTLTNTPANLTAEIWIPLQRWARVNHLGLPTRWRTAPTPTYALQSSNGVFVLRAGSQVAQWDGLALRLGFAPQMINGQPYVHTLDLSKCLQPLLEGEPAIPLSPSPVIVIDPGHGGENAGAKSVLGAHYEKEFTLDWALRLQTLLAARNYRTFLTRTNDTDLALSNRVAFAADHKADIFVSLHFNSAAPNETEAGLETYCLTPVGMPSNLTRGFPDEVRQTFPNNAFDAQNLRLALQVHRALLQVNGHHDRGVRRARFPGVLRGQQRPAVLVEGGYLSNPQEARLIGQGAYRQKLAEALAKALLQNSDAAGQGLAQTAIPAAGNAREYPHEDPATDGTYSQAGPSEVLSEVGTKSQDSRAHTP